MMHQHHATWYKGSIPLVVFRDSFSLHITQQSNINQPHNTSNPTFSYLLCSLFHLYLLPVITHSFRQKGKLQQF